ncbi:hypothetical protein M0R45_034546 [Rubus argutus]|uniref:Retrotransposon gag protein n=1 Tax=Rubus argutus TaxID=59490 RepID=A0AAW1VRR9_RUBAR
MWHSSSSIPCCLFCPPFMEQTKERPYDHIIEFDAICNTLNRGNLTFPELKLRLFHFHSRRRQECGFTSLNQGAFTLGMRCKRRLDNACGGNFQKKGPNAAWDIIEEIAVQSGQWDHHDRRRDTRMRESDERDVKPQIARGQVHIENHPRAVHGTSQIQQVDHQMKAKLEQLETSMNSKLDLLLKKQGGAAMSSSSNQAHAISTACFYCGSSTHEAIDCEFYVAAVGQEVINEQLYSVGKFNDKVFPSRLNPQPMYAYGKKGCWKLLFYEYPSQDLSRRKSRAPQRQSYYQPPPGFEHNGGTQQAQDTAEPSMREMLNALTKSQLKSDQKHDSLCDQVSVINQGLRKLEVEVGNISKQLHSRPQGALPSQTEQNPRHESVRAITTLRSGKSYDNSIYYDPHAHNDTPSSFTTFMRPCLNSENLFEENGVGGEENVPSNNLERGDYNDLLRRNKGVDKAAGREENVPTGEKKRIQSTGKDMLLKKLGEDLRKTRKKKQKKIRPDARKVRPDGLQKWQHAREIRPDGMMVRPDAMMVRPDSLSDTSEKMENPCDPLPLGKGFGQLSLDPDFERQDYNKRKKRDKEVTFEQNKEDGGNSQLPYADIPRRSNLSIPPLNVTTSPVPLPFPQAPRKEELQKKNNKHRREFIELFQKVNINIPLLDAIKQFSPYAKFLKELCTNKRKFTKDEQITLSEEVSAVLLGKLPPKLKDPGSFTVPCTIGNKDFEGAMLDLGASINLMPYHIYKTLSLDDINLLT